MPLPMAPAHVKLWSFPLRDTMHFATADQPDLRKTLYKLKLREIQFQWISIQKSDTIQLRLQLSQKFSLSDQLLDFGNHNFKVRDS